VGSALLSEGEGISALIIGLVRQKPDVILVVGTPSALAAKAATSTIPIVFAGAGDPVESGLVNSLANPGGNITGISNNQRELTHKRFGLFREVIPDVTRVAVLLDPALALAPILWREAEDAARILRMRLARLDARTGAEIETAFQEMAKAGVQAVLVMPSGTFWVEGTRIARLASQHRLPSMCPSRSEVEAGGLMSYGGSDLECAQIAVREAPRWSNFPVYGCWPRRPDRRHRRRSRGRYRLTFPFCSISQPRLGPNLAFGTNREDDEAVSASSRSLMLPTTRRFFAMTNVPRGVRNEHRR
jgi:hypothetical protein